MLRIAEHVQLTDTGRQRRENEDAFHARPPLFVVADGMGGAQAGEVASRTAVEVFNAGLPDGPGSVEERLAALVAEANSRIHALAVQDADRAGMGTTLTAAYLDQTDLAIAHVGDSRLYAWRDGTLEQRTDDHSLVGELVRRGQLSPEEAEEHPQRSIITRALGPEGEVEVDHHTLPTRDGDVFLLCSDGLSTMVSDGGIAEILDGSSTLNEAARGLIRAANDAGGRDNITVLLFRVEDVGDLGAAPATDDVSAGHTVISRPSDRTEGTVPPVRRTEGTVPSVQAARAPRAPRAAPPKDRPRWRGWLRGGVIVAVVLAVLGLPAFFAIQSVYWLGTSDDGFVALYRGVPYELPGGIELYQQRFVSGAPVAGLPAATRTTVRERELRAFEDARDLIRKIERGELVEQ